MTRTRRNTVAAPPSHRPYRAAGREQRKAETRARILESAIRLFSERGFDAATVREISADAGVTHAAIRLHFGTKERLWRAAIDRLFARQCEEVGVPGSTNVEHLPVAERRAFVHRYVQYCARHPEHVRIMVHESLRDTARLAWLAKTHILPAQAPALQAYKSARRRSLVAAYRIPSVIYCVVAASQMVFALGAELKHLYGFDVNDPRFVALHADTICAMLGAAARSRRATRRQRSRP